MAIDKIKEMPIENRLIQILYIHGFVGEKNTKTANAIANALPKNYCFFEPSYFPINPDEALEMAKNIIQTEEIDIVVTASLGAFTALQLRGIPKILINPYLYPSKELPKRIDVPESIL